MAVKSSEYAFPRAYNFPPFFTPQPNALTRAAQLRQWSSLVQSYCRHHRLFKISLIDAVDTPLFHNARLKKRLGSKDAKDIVDYMVSREGDERAEWTGADKASAWIWWRKPEEWASVVEGWVDETGQKGTVLTFYELVEEKQRRHKSFMAWTWKYCTRVSTPLLRRAKPRSLATKTSEV